MTSKKTPENPSTDQQSLRAEKRASVDSEQSSSLDKQEPLLRTPAGPIPEDKLSHVPRGKRVRLTPEGNYVIEDEAPRVDTATGQGDSGSSQAENEDG